MLAALGLLASSAAALGGKLGAGSSLWIEGDSTMHAFTSTSTATQFTLSSPSADPAAMLSGQAPVQMTVTVPVEGLKSHSGGLDKNLRKTMKAEEFPNVTFVLTGYKAAKDAVTATGDLTIAGVKKTVELTGSLKLEAGKMVVDGQKELLMSEYGIKPPKLMMGAIKVADRVVVKYHLNIETETKEAK